MFTDLCVCLLAFAYVPKATVGCWEIEKFRKNILIETVSFYVNYVRLISPTNYYAFNNVLHAFNNFFCNSVYWSTIPYTFWWFLLRKWLRVWTLLADWAHAERLFLCKRSILRNLSFSHVAWNGNPVFMHKPNKQP